MTPSPRQILLLEDDAETAQAIREELSGVVDVVVAQNYTEALDHLYRIAGLVAVVAHQNVRHGGGGARFMVEARRVRPGAYRLLYSSSATASADALTFADGFIVRPWNGGALRSHVEAALVRGPSEAAG